MSNATAVNTFQHVVLDNGLTIIGEHQPGAKSLAMGYFVRTGSRDEVLSSELSESGVSHFLEHMMFKGSASLAASDINQQFDDIGAKYNASTSEELTCYYGAVLPEYQPQLLHLFTEMMQPALRQEDFDTEKEVILEEIEMYQDQADIVLYDALRPWFYGNHPSGQSILGSSASIRALTREAMADYCRRRYAPNNLVLAITGNYDWQALYSQVKQATTHWQPAEIGRRYQPHHPKPQAQTLIQPRFHQRYCGLMAPGVSIQDSLHYAADILAAIIGDDDNSRLYWGLVDQGLAETASLSHSGEDGGGHYYGLLVSQPEQAQEVLETALGVLQQVQHQGITSDELRRNQRKIAVAEVLRAETPYGRLFPFALDYLDNHEYVSVQTCVDRVMAVTVADLEHLLSKRPFDVMSVMGLGAEAP
jgi:predicted Zn-dependent peptidase